jgi:hypothetical protein
MHRTQIYLEDGMYRELSARARSAGTTLAALIRDLLDEALIGLRRDGPDPLDAVVGVAAGDGAAVAENHADYLYGGPVDAAPVSGEERDVAGREPRTSRGKRSRR